MKNNFFKNYSFSLILLASIAIGAGLGIVFKEKIAFVKPLGDIFLNLLFTAVVPLVFFSISSAIAEMSDLHRLGKIMGWMMFLFVATGLISASLMIVGVKLYPPALADHPILQAGAGMTQVKTVEQLVGAFTVPDFVQLLSKQNMLALIVFSLLVGLSASLAREDGKAFVNVLVSGNKVMMKMIHLIMFYAPVGLGAYFAYLTGVFGPSLLGAYFRIVALYYPLAILYFFLGFSFYALLAGGMQGVKRFWANIIPASLTALGTGSSLATIPSNIEAADRIGVPRDISKIVIPIGATVHMDGTCISAVVKIALLFSFFGMKFAGIGTLVTALGIALLSGIVMTGIPGGGFLGELLIVTLYGFPPEALPVIAMVGTLVDPPATMVNAIGSNSVSMIIARILGGPRWMKKTAEPA
jgi:Na+/H+-dicarboxylate symporter